MHGRTRQPLGSRQLVKRFAAAAGADLQTLHAHQQTTREFVADLSARVDGIQKGAYDVERDEFVALSEMLRRINILTAFQARSFWARLRWLLTGR